MEPNNQPQAVPDQPETVLPIVKAEPSLGQPYANETIDVQPTPELVKPVVASESFGAAASPTMPVGQISTPPLPVPPVVVPTTLVNVGTPEVAVLPAKRKHPLWLWLALGAVVLIIAVIAVVYFR